MKKLVSILTICLVGASAVAATPSTDRRSMSSQWGSASRATMSKNQINTLNRAQGNESGTGTVKKEIDTREKEKDACVNNNIGAGNTFVWASRYGNTGVYSLMVEDTEVPENNSCFVRVELKSDDAKIGVADIEPVYYEMGRNITCGSWADAEKLEKRILDAKKSSRTWGTVAGVVGGAGIGVGAMELFGNKMIGGSVQGQKSLKDSELLRSQMLVLKDKKPTEFDALKKDMLLLKNECENTIWNDTDVQKPEECKTIDYNFLLNIK